MVCVQENGGRVGVVGTPRSSMVIRCSEVIGFIVARRVEIWSSLSKSPKKETETYYQNQVEGAHNHLRTKSRSA